MAQIYREQLLAKMSSGEGGEVEKEANEKQLQEASGGEQTD